MRAKRFIVPVLMTIFVLVTLSSGYATDKERGKKSGRQFKVTITNLTRGQIVSPPIVFSHTGNFNFFDVGTPASDGLALMAEDGDTSGLEAELLEKASVYSVVAAGGGVPPGASVTVDLETRRPFRYISTAGMLVVSNDAFFAARNLRLPWYGEVVYYARAYDSGSEANTESCKYIPGPPCGSVGERDTDDAEGFIHVHAGIHGIGDLAPEDSDWRNPVVRIKIQAVRK